MILLKYFIKETAIKNKNFLILLIVIFLNVLTNPSFAAISIVDYFNLDELKSCLRKSNFEECQKFILIMEKLQIEESNKGNFRCQTTLLGIQTELIKKFYFEKNETVPELIIHSNLIKNC